MTTLKELREYLGLTQEELGQALGITASTISRYERGQHQRIKFTFSQIKRLQALLEQVGLSINDLPDDDDPTQGTTLKVCGTDRAKVEE